MKTIPYFANLPDGTHCYQAALKMVLFHFSDKEWSFEELDRLSGKLPGRWTWPTQSFLWLLDHGYEVRLVELFSYEKFATEGEKYLIQELGEEVAREQEANSDLSREQTLAAQFAKKATLEKRIPSWEDLKSFMKDGYLIICNINSCKLFDREGYAGHFVVPVRLEKDHLILHDPGLPPKPSLKVERTIFEKAWGYPTESAKNLLALRLAAKKNRS